MSLNRVRLYYSFKFWREQANSEKHPKRAPESIPWLSKTKSKSTPAFRFTKQKKLVYTFHKPEHPFREHYQTRPYNHCKFRASLVKIIILVWLCNCVIQSDSQSFCFYEIWRSLCSYSILIPNTQLMYFEAT